MSSVYYVLVNKQAVATDDVLVWGRFFENIDNRRVAKTAIGDSSVSTVFLGIDHAFGGGPPLLFETMVFGGPLENECDRCSTWEQAEAMHEAMCARVRTAS